MSCLNKDSDPETSTDLLQRDTDFGCPDEDVSFDVMIKHSGLNRSQCFLILFH